MRFGSVCSGIEAASVAWKPLEWQAAWFSEIEPFPCAVLKHHYPNVPNYGDMTKFKDWPDEPIDLLCGGTPCQSFSVAGLRKGLDDPRGDLMLTFGAIAARYRPAWLVWENVPGVLSSNGGRDFGTFLGMLGQLGYGFAYRVLDAQHFGVPQRRRRVFVVGCLGDWRRAAAVLFERHSLSGDIAPRRKTGEGAASSTKGGVELCGPLAARDYKDPGVDGMNSNSAKMIPVWPADVASTLNAHFGKKQGLENQHVWGGAACLSPELSLCLTTGGRMDAESETLIPTTGGVFSYAPAKAAIAIQGNLIGRDAGGPQGVGASDEGVMYTLTKADVHGVAQPVTYDLFNVTAPVNRQSRKSGDPCHTLAKANAEHAAVVQPQAMQVRRLTPTECERLQGFPDGYTAIPWRNKLANECPDGPRYKALGNSWAVPVVRWIGERINAVQEIREAA